MNYMSNTFDHSVGLHVRRLRLMRGMTQQELARLMRVSFQQVQKYERGINKLSFERAHFLSTLFCVSLNNLAGGNEARMLEDGPDRQALRLLQAFQTASVEHRAIICMLAEALGEKALG